MKILDLGNFFDSGKNVRFNFGENFRFWNFLGLWVMTKILDLGTNFRFGQKL